jgi:delta8-fatty-acid desaturase
MPFFAISPAFLDSLWSSYYKRVLKFDRFAKIALSFQHKIYYLVMAFGRLNLYVNSYTFLYQKAFDTKRAKGGNWAWRLEMTGILFFWTWYCRLLYGCGSWQMALVYFLVSHVVTSPLHIQVTRSLNF